MTSMWLRYLIITLLFFVFALLQASFLPYFNIFGANLNIVFILFFILIFFNKNREGFFIAIIAGIFLDLFLPLYFGLSIISLLLIYSLKEITIYFLKDSQEKFSIIYFAPMFSASFIIYQFILYLYFTIFNLQPNINQSIIAGLIYNLIFAIAGFYVYKILLQPDNLENQLKLF